MTDHSSELLKHADDVWRIAVRLLSNEDEALECYQQTFLDALGVSPEDVRNWKAVMCRIATCRAMDRLRRRYRNREISPPTELAALDHAEPQQRLELEELRENVRIVLSKLPKLQAEAFFLRHIEHRNPAEIASQLNIDAGHVRVLVHRAASELRRRLPTSFQPSEPQVCARNERKD